MALYLCFSVLCSILLLSKEGELNIGNKFVVINLDIMPDILMPCRNLEDLSTDARKY